MDSLSNILGRMDFREPSEIKLIQAYVLDNFKSNVEVVVRDKDIIINVPNAALANTLRLRGPELKKVCATNKRLIFHIA